MNIELDTGPLSWVKEEIEHALIQVGEQLQQYIARADADVLTKALANARLHMHQASGALAIVGLNGVTEFAQTIEQLLEALAEGSVQWSATTNEAMQQALIALRQHLSGIVAGQPNQALRLLPAYRRLNEARGILHTSPGALFFPDLTQRPPKRGNASTADTTNTANTAAQPAHARLKAARMGFERGLAKWLQGDRMQQTGGVRDMRNSIAIIESMQDQPGTRAFWWVTLAYFDALAAANGAAGNDTRLLCERIGVQVGKLLDGAHAVAERLMRDVLYEVAATPATNAHIEQVRAVYRLREELPAETARGDLPGAASAASAPEEAARRQALTQAAGELRRELQQVEQALDTFFRDPRRTDVIAQLPEQLREIAFRFNRLEQQRAKEAALECVQQVNDFLAPDFSQRADAAATTAVFQRLARTLSALTLFTEKLPLGHADLDALLAPLPLAAESAQPAQASGSVEAELGDQLGKLQLSLQALSRLQHETSHDSSVQQILRSELQAILATLRDDARLVANAQVEQHAQAAIDLLGAAGSAATVAQIETAVAPLLVAIRPARIQRLPQADQAGFSAAEIDAELLAIFIEECEQQLEAIRQELTRLQSASVAAESLAPLRRSFHTLKGSARMLGLKAFSEAAWAVELTLGRCLKEQRPVSPALIEMIDTASGIVAAWIDSLQKQTAPPDAQGLHLQCQALNDAPNATTATVAASNPAATANVDTAAPAAPATVATAVEANEEAEALLKIGPLRLQPDHLEHFLAEARASLSALQLHWQRVPTTQMVHAARILEQSAEALGFAPIQQVAGAFARALERFVDADQVSDAAQDTALQMCLRRLGTMVKNVADHHYPRADEELVTWIDALLPSSLAAYAAPAMPATAAAAATDDALLPIFLEECDDLVPAIATAFRSWRKAGNDDIDALLRGLHTLKGSARMAGVADVGEHVHAIETRIAQAQTEFAAQSTNAASDISPVIDALEGGFANIVKRIDDLRAASHAAAETYRPTLRVPADAIDAMVDESGEIAIMRSHLEGGMKAFRASLGDLNDNVARLRMQLRELEIQAESRIQAHAVPTVSTIGRADFDPLEMDRFTRLHEQMRILAESVDDVATVQQGLMRHVDQADDALMRQSRLSRALTQRLLGVRMVPFAAVAERLQRVVRQTTAEAGKEATLQIEGGDAELDRSVLERITGPIEHLLRNAVVHGIERADRRKAAGKPREGTIRLALTHADNEVVISVGDDGAGLDLVHIRKEADRRGLLGDDAAVASSFSDEEVLQLIYQPGFTTASRLSEIAGRGIGMDVVRSETTALGGRIEVDNHPGQGITFALHLPLTLAVIPVVLVRAAAHTYAIPASMVVHADEMTQEAITAMRALGGVQQQGQYYALHYFPRLLGDLVTQPQLQRRHWVLLLRGGVHHIALEVDSLGGHEEVVIKNTGPQLARAPGIGGATLLGDGRIVLIINPIALVSWHRARMTRSRLGSVASVAPVTASRTPGAAAPAVVMVVDDSLTVRKISGRLLERAGYRVMTAKDGVDALEQLQQMTDTLPTVMLADIEMPRMDGFELLRRLRLDARFKDMPVIMITSRGADKHRNFAAELGADHYLGKPYDETALLGLIADYANKQKPMA